MISRGRPPLLSELLFSRGGPPPMKYKLIALSGGHPIYELTLRDGPSLSWWNVKWFDRSRTTACGPWIGGPDLKLQYKKGLKSGWLFYHFTSWSREGPTPKDNFFDSHGMFLPLHRGVFCQFPLRWIYYCHSSKSTGKEISKTLLTRSQGGCQKSGALYWILI
jgi:hypothetical protein